jgi:serine/threonine protein phosphatase PrpC
MQDYVYISSVFVMSRPILLIGVLDGHGSKGEVAAQVVWKEMHAKITTGLARLHPQDWTDESLLKLLTRSSLEVEALWKVAFAQEYANAKTGGTTMNLHMKIGEDLWCVNVGDSRSALLTDKQEGVQLSLDANCKDDLFCMEFKERGGQIRSGRAGGILAMTTSFEGEEFPGVRAIPKITKTKADQNCCLITASDGLWDNLSTTEVLAYVSKRLEEKISPGQIARELVDIAVEMDLIDHDETDNISVIVAKLTEEYL